MDGKIEMFRSDGAYLGTCKTVGWQKAMGDWDWLWYYVEDTNGTLAKGWRTIKGVTYYFSTYDSYMYYNDYYYIDGKYYYFDDNGALRTGWIDLSWGGKYYADENGVLQKGWKSIDGYQYYFDDGSFYMYRSGYYTIDGNEYYFDNKGRLVD